MYTYLGQINLTNKTYDEILVDLEALNISAEKYYKNIGIIKLKSSIELLPDFHENIVGLELIEKKFFASEEE